MPIYAPDGRLVTAYVAPTPQPELEEALRKQLKELDELLDLVWVTHAAYVNERWEGRYALTLRWSQNDPAWERVREGKCDTPYDILGWLCEDMQDGNSYPTSLDGVANKVFECLAKQDNTRFPAKDRMKSVMEKNLAHRKRLKADMVDEMTQRMRYYGPRMSGTVSVPVATNIGENDE